MSKFDLQICRFRDGSVDYPDGSDIIERLVEAGFTAEPEQTELTVKIPNTLTETEQDALAQLTASKATLI